ncbi:MarR family winged helix-turn-helix transcriptional regulator [Variovorax terrae]|uniref:MarR family transcriptional regulator n=1 Tax=Variovorax terrae TaxID=2923278 RepID=A0A9X2ALQ9_9BURK|nr:MarR family transcriptional regulator [Variovorax terrae]MCJ0762559.1 MarR family transcriptional regulator [Variovorax terrae]
MDSKVTATATDASAGKDAGFYDPDNYFAEQSLGYLLRKTVTRLGQAVEQQMEPNGLTNAQWVPLLKLYRGHASTAAELARECELDAGSMTRLLDRVEAKGLCSRERSSEDRRVVNLKLTDEGREAAREIPVVLARVQNACLAGFTHEEWQTLKGYLLRILSNAQALVVNGESNEK